VRLCTQAFRAHHPGWAFAPASGEGAAIHGGRFNRKGRNALYTSLSMQTAWTEAQQAFPFKAQPVTLCTYDVDCDHIEDLTDASTLARLVVNPADLASPWEDLAGRGLAPPSWTLADRLIAGGASGIIVPSFASRVGTGARNVVFWDWSDRPPHRVRVIDDQQRLPRDRSSWS
jgi:RES domain-containing protein